MNNQKRPNILWIMTDQHQTNALSCMWEDLSEAPYECTERNLTPNLDRLARDGVLFTNTYCPSPVCGPARASMKTGKFPPANGAISNWVELRKENTFLPQLVRDNGYVTGMAGKLHLFHPERDYGFQDRHLSDAPYGVYWEDDKHSEYIKWLREKFFNAKGVDPVSIFDEDELAYDSDLKRFILGSCFRTKEEHETAWTTECTLNFLRSWDGGKPFFYYTSYFGPHQPYGAPDPYNNFCKPEDVRMPDSYYHDYHKGSPVFEAKCRKKFEHVQKNLTEQDCKELVAEYLGQVHMIDESIGEIITYLKEKGIYDDTVIIFSSDHGDHLGAHGIFFKGEMYDTCAKVPLIIKPAHACKTHRRAEIVNTIDLFRTILDLTGVEWTDHTVQEEQDVESRSLVPLIDEQEIDWENVTHSIIGTKRDSCYCMVRSGDWKLSRVADGPEHAFYELFNLKEDPQEIRNRYEDADCAAVAEALRNDLDAWFRVQYRNYGGNPSF